MKTSDFSFNLPEELIAQEPLQEREESRLLVLNRKSGSITHSRFRNLPTFLKPGSICVFNNTRVRKARIYAETEFGGKVELIFLKQLQPDLWEVIAGKAKKQKKGKVLILPGDISSQITESLGQKKHLKVSRELSDDYFTAYGHVPLPPYIKRPDTRDDEKRYQTVFSRETGSVAAPTAGLHFSQPLLQDLSVMDIRICYITLHVGIGTFLPIRTENVEDHTMHEEDFTISETTASIINAGKKEGRPIVAVGTTTVRTLESAYTGGNVKEGRQTTDLFIYPPYKFQVVDHMITNFHTPESSLLVMVSAFAGKELIDRVYAEAVDRKYRFFSYGDAMFIQ